MNICPCGQYHDISEGLGRLTGTLPTSVPVNTIWGTWEVPRVYIAVHGLKAYDLPRLAGEYNWKQVA